MKQTNTDTRPVMTYTVLDDDIHNFVFYEASNRAVDTWFDVIVPLFETFTADTQVRLIIDVRLSGVLPLSYGFSKTRNWVNNLTVRPKTRLAYVHNGDFLVSLFTAFANSMRIDTLALKVFDPKIANQAVDWLLSDK